MREEELLLKSPPSRGWTSLSRAAEGLDQQLGMYPAFGGDILAAVEVVKAVAKRMNRLNIL